MCALLTVELSFVESEWVCKNDRFIYSLKACQRRFLIGYVPAFRGPTQVQELRDPDVSISCWDIQGCGLHSCPCTPGRAAPEGCVLLRPGHPSPAHTGMLSASSPPCQSRTFHKHLGGHHCFLCGHVHKKEHVKMTSICCPAQPKNVLRGHVCIFE